MYTKRNKRQHILEEAHMKVIIIKLNTSEKNKTKKKKHVEIIDICRKQGTYLYSYLYHTTNVVAIKCRNKQLVM